MKDELQKALYDKYSDLFANHNKSPQESCMHWGITCGDGWYAIIDHLCEELTDLQEKYDIRIIFDQIKEKFGCLRVYYHIELGLRWSQSDDVSLLDGKAEIELVRSGWIHSGKTMPAYEGVCGLITECISKADDFSSFTCEFCGMTGAKACGYGWIHTLCDVCEAKRKKEQEKEV